MAARYSLADVRAAAAEGSVELDASRALDTTTPYFATLLEVQRFAQDVVLALEETDWRKSLSLQPPHAGEYDVYEKALPAELCAKHGVDREWYVKLRLIEGLYGDSVFLVSLHPPEHPFKRPTLSRLPGGRA